MTAAELIQQGVVFERAGGRITVRGPAGRKDLHDAILFEVETRVGLVGAGVDFALRGMRGDGRCDVAGCGDQLPAGQTSGVCALCALARQKVADQAQRRLEGLGG